MDVNKENKANEQTNKELHKYTHTHACSPTPNQSISVHIFDSEFSKTNDINVIMV